MPYKKAHLSKKLLAIALCAMMLFTLLPTTALAAGDWIVSGGTIPGTSYATLPPAIAAINADTGTTYTINGGGGSESYNTTLSVNAGKMITIDGGATITQASGRHFNVSGSLTLKNITLGGANTGGGVNVESGGSLTMTSGAVIQNSLSSTSGGGVYNAGTFTMNGGTISGNTSQDGGAIYNNSGTVNIKGGTTITGGIYNNTSGTLNVGYGNTVDTISGDGTTNFEVLFGVTGTGGNLTATEGGSSIATGDFVESGNGLIFSATPDAGYRVKQWSVKQWTDNSSAANSTGDSYSITSLDSPYKVMVEFEPIPAYEVTFSVTGGNGGLSATVDGIGITSGAQVAEGKDIVFAVSPSGNYSVKGWELNGTTVSGNTSNTYTLQNLSASATVTVSFLTPTVNSVTVSPSTPSVYKGGTQQFTADVDVTGGAAQTVTWSVDSTLSSIDANGKLSVSMNETSGTLTVTATSTVDSTKKDTAIVTVTQYGTSYPVRKGFSVFTGSGDRSATIDAPYAKFLRLLVDDVELDPSNYTVTEGSTIITLKESYLKTLSNGDYRVLAMFTDGQSETNLVVDVSGSTVKATGVTLDKTTASVTVGKTLQLTAKITPDNATDKDVTWKSSDTSIATVDNNGVVTAVAPGTAKIVVTTQDGNFTAVCDVTVSTAVISVTGVTLNKTSATLKSGRILQLTATASPDNATDKGVTWKSSDTSIATVDKNGLVKGVKAGKSIITVTTDDGGYTAICEVTVTAASSTSKTTSTSSTPKTDDSSNMTLWVLLGLSSILATVAMIYSRKYKNPTGANLD